MGGKIKRHVGCNASNYITLREEMKESKDETAQVIASHKDCFLLHSEGK